jgi:uncharacterized delta-60 repeat protein
MFKRRLSALFASLRLVFQRCGTKYPNGLLFIHYLHYPMIRITIVLAILLFASGQVHGQAAYLDKTFGDQGVVRVTYPTGQLASLFNIHILPDGKIIHVNQIYDPIDGFCLYIMRHYADGRIDSSFGDNGSSRYILPHSSEEIMLYHYPDGRLLLYGSKQENYSSQNNIAIIIRFLADGRVDSSFGTNGTYKQPRSTPSSFFQTITVSNDGTIYAFGRRQRSGSSSSEYLPTITRITPRGINDSTFADMGEKIVGPQADTGEVWTAVMYGEDRCIFSISDDRSSNTPLNMICTDLDGVIDSSFGTDGKIRIQLSDDFEFVADIMTTTDQKIICTAVLSEDHGANYKTILLRLLPTGALDTSFGEFGIAPVPNDKYQRSASNIVLDSNKNIIQYGDLYDADSAFYSILMRYTHNGQIDSSYGKNGTLTELSTYVLEISSVVLDQEGKVVVMGYSALDVTPSIIICRLNNSAKEQVVSALKRPSSASVHPTPSTDNCTATYTLPVSGNCTMTLRDESGRQVRTFAMSEYRTTGEHKEELDLRGLVSGVYFLQIESGGVIQTAKLIKQ